MRDKKKLINELKINKLPVLVLNETWCGLFSPDKKTEKILFHEQNVRVLLKSKQELPRKITELTQNKKLLLNEILELTEKAFTQNDQTIQHQAKSRMEEAQKQVYEINEEIDSHKERLESLPERIDAENLLLFQESVLIAHNRMVYGKRELKKLAPQIQALRRQLAEKTEAQSLYEDDYKKINAFLLRFIGKNALNDLDSAVDEEKNHGFRNWYRRFRNKAD